MKKSYKLKNQNLIHYSLHYNDFKGIFNPLNTGASTLCHLKVVGLLTVSGICLWTMIHLFKARILKHMPVIL